MMPISVQDVALVSLSNVLYRSGFDMDALAVIHMSLEVGYSSPSLEVNVVCFPIFREKSFTPCTQWCIFQFIMF